jgi:hypothetical protein
MKSIMKMSPMDVAKKFPIDEELKEIWGLSCANDKW